MNNLTVSLACAVAFTISAGTYAADHTELAQSVNEDLSVYLEQYESLEEALAQAVEDNPELAGVYLQVAYAEQASLAEGTGVSVDMDVLVSAAVRGAIASGSDDALAQVVSSSMDLASAKEVQDNSLQQTVVARALGKSVSLYGNTDDVAVLAASLATSSTATGASEEQTLAMIDAMVLGVRLGGDEDEFESALVALKGLLSDESVKTIAQNNNASESFLAELDALDSPASDESSQSSEEQLASADEESAGGGSRPGDIGFGSGSGNGEQTASPN